MHRLMQHEMPPSFSPSPLCFTPSELKRLSFELDHPVDDVSHTANLCLRRDFLNEKRRRLRAAIGILHPNGTPHPDDEATRHTRVARDVRSVDAALRTVTLALDALRAKSYVYSN
jgi:hypothetical protein